MISERDLEILESFHRDGQIMLTAYLNLDSAEHRESAYHDFIDLAEQRLEECGPRAECQEAIREDMEIVGLYLKTNGHRPHTGLAIFSCANELFWRAYPLPRPVETAVSVGPRFEVEPLREIARQFVSA
ncbi:MAG: hypothetical protein PVJ34_03600 [Anaerolineae bacterium]